MAVTRSITRKQNQDARKRSKTSENNNCSSSTWSNLSYDLLFTIMMQLEAIDFSAFASVCNSWRTFAILNKKEFMASRQPMSLSLSSKDNNQECQFEDFTGTKYKTMILNSSGRVCVGLTCGYLIFFGRKNNDFWLLNPVTKHGLHFPRFPYHVGPNLKTIKGILVFSPSLSGLVFVVSLKLSNIVSFSLSSKKGRWTNLMSNYRIRDLHLFNGKIYTLNMGGRLFEVKVNPNPTLTLIGIKTFISGDFLCPEFVSWNENLYVLDFITKSAYSILEVDFDEMKWVMPKNNIGEYAYLVNVLKCGTASNIDIWVLEQYERFGYFDGINTSKNKGLFFSADMWYFPRDCSMVNRLKE